MQDALKIEIGDDNFAVFFTSKICIKMCINIKTGLSMMCFAQLKAASGILTWCLVANRRHLQEDVILPVTSY